MLAVALSEVAQINPRWSSGAGPTAAVSFVGMANLCHELGQVTGEELRRVSEVRTGYTPFEPDDLLVAKITPCFENGKIGRATISESYGAGSTEFHVVRPGERLDVRYALHFLRRPRFRAAGELRMTGSGGQRRVPAEYVSSTKIPLPSLAEQRRIADILDKAGDLRASRRKAITNLDGLGQSIFHEMFGQGTKERLSELGVVQGGLQVTHKRKELPLEIPYLRVANVYRGRLELAEVKTMGVTEAELERTKLREGDLLFVEGHGNVEEVGRCAMWIGSKVVTTHQNHLIRFRPNRSRVLPEFATQAVNSAFGNDSLARRAKTTSGLNTITTSNVRDFEISVPPLALQREFANHIAVLERLKASYLAQLSELDNLFLSLQDRAFKGEL